MHRFNPQSVHAGAVCQATDDIVEAMFTAVSTRTLKRIFFIDWSKLSAVLLLSSERRRCQHLGRTNTCNHFDYAGLAEYQPPLARAPRW